MRAIAATHLFRSAQNTAPARSAPANGDGRRNDNMTPAASSDAFKRSDFDLNGGPAAFGDFAHATPRPAAVLVPIIARADPTVLFTVRPTTMTEHAGQIAFPGGRADPDDADARATALREAQEEIGLSPVDAEVIGYLENYRTVTSYLVTPVVALIRDGFIATPNPLEVSDVFEVPLAFLMSADNHRIDARTYRGEVRRYHAMPYGERYIWGATAGILKMLHESLTHP